MLLYILESDLLIVLNHSNAQVIFNKPSYSSRVSPTVFPWIGSSIIILIEFRIKVKINPERVMILVQGEGSELFLARIERRLKRFVIRIKSRVGL